MNDTTQSAEMPQKYCEKHSIWYPHNIENCPMCLSKKTEDYVEKGTIASVGTGAVTGAVAGVGGVIAGGAAGASGAAALTSGLATLGSVVGGGMLAGIGVVAAAPIAFGAAGFCVYKLYKKLSTKS